MQYAIQLALLHKRGLNQDGLGLRALKHLRYHC